MTKEEFYNKLDKHLQFDQALGLYVVPLAVLQTLLEDVEFASDIDPKEQIGELTTKLSELQQTLSTLKNI